MKFAVYLHKETCLTNRPVKESEYIGQSLPHYNKIRHVLEFDFKDYPSIELNRADIANFLSVHNKNYFDKIIALSKDQKIEGYPLSAECTALYYAIPGFEYGLGGMYNAIDKMENGELDRALCFSLPSHHAHPDRGHGYCVFNTQAAAVKYAQSVGFKNILIIDWDIHHGDGTQAIFENDSSVYQISIHNGIDLYMTKAEVHDLGTTIYGESVGHCNIPLVDTIYDEKFIKDCELKGNYYNKEESIPLLLDALKNVPYNPDMVFIFAGQDSHKDDCGSGVTDWENKDFETLMKSVIDQFNCPILATPGGGYKFETTIGVAKAYTDILANYRKGPI